jgi:hypothetical protein
MKIETFFGPEVATIETHVHKINNVPVFYMTLGLNDFDGANPLLVPLEEVDPCHKFVRIKIITSRVI